MKIVTVLSERMAEKEIIKQEDISIYQYGIENGIILSLNMLTAVSIGLVTGRLIEILAFLLAFISLRSFSGGFHLESKVMCYICSNLILLIPAYAAEISRYCSKMFSSTVINIEIVIVMCATVIIFINSPMDSNKRKLDLAERKHFKVRARSILIVQAVIIVILYFFKRKFPVDSLCISLCTIAVLMLIRKVQLIWQGTSE